jgi:hypothetical protein
MYTLLNTAKVHHSTIAMSLDDDTLDIVEVSRKALRVQVTALEEAKEAHLRLETAVAEAAKKVAGCEASIVASAEAAEIVAGAAGATLSLVVRVPRVVLSVQLGGLWVVSPSPDEPFGPSMFVSSDIDELSRRRPALLDLQAELKTSLPRRLWSKNARRQGDNCVNPGQFYLGMSDMGGHHTQAVLGRQVPFFLSSELALQALPCLYQKVTSLEALAWDYGRRVFPAEAARMLSINSSLRRSATGFTSGAIACNLPAQWHVDEKNMLEGFQVVVVLGCFTGGAVLFDPAGRHGRGAESRSLGRERDCFSVCNRHGMLFIGKYRQVWHRVERVTSGERMIVAFWAKQSLVDFSETMSRSSFTWSQITALKRERVAAVRSLRRIYPDVVKRKRARAAVTGAWREYDIRVGFPVKTS